MLREIVQSMRPHQWVKNTFVLAPLVFSRNLDSPGLVVRALLALVVFCLASSAVYLVNDICDIPNDRLHPSKATRPIASGRLSVRHAKIAALILLGLALFGSLELWWPFVGTLLGYVVLNLAYSLYLKRVVFLDVTLIGLGFLLRVLAGAQAIQVPISIWLIVCTFLLSLYLALGKRKHELLTVGDMENTRRVLRYYNLSHIKVAMAIAAAVTAICYLAYSLDPVTAIHVGTSLLPITVPFIIVGLVRFYFLAQRAHVTRSPTEQLVKDPVSVFNILFWGAVVVFLIYY